MQAPFGRDFVEPVDLRGTRERDEVDPTLGLKLLHHLGARVTGRDGVDADRRAPLGRQHPGHHHDRGLRRAISQTARKGRERHDRRGVDDRAAARLQHVTRGLARAKEHRGHVEIDNLAPPVEAQLERGQRGRHARVVDQDVELAECFDGPSDQRLRARLGRDVGGDAHGTSAEILSHAVGHGRVA